MGEESVPKIYSPSQTAEWSRCPFLWDVTYKRGWRLTVAGPRDVAQVLGQAFGVGMCIYNRKARKYGLAVSRFHTHTIECAKRGAVATFQRTLEKFRTQGIDLSGLSRLGELVDALAAAVERAIKEDPTPVSWVVECAEKTMPEHGWARADVVYVTGEGERVVRDYKFTMSPPLPKYLPGRMEDYANHPQGFHYAWMHGASIFIPTLVAVGPNHFKQHELPKQRTFLDIVNWVSSQRVKWAIMEKMEKGELPVWRSDHHKTQYGKCALYEFCMDYEGVTERLPALGFVQIERKKRAGSG